MKKPTKPPRDTNQLAKQIVDLSTADEPTAAPKVKAPATPQAKAAEKPAGRKKK